MSTELIYTSIRWQKDQPTTPGWYLAAWPDGEGNIKTSYWVRGGLT